MKPGSLLKRVTSREPRDRSSGHKGSKGDNSPLVQKNEVVKTPTRRQQQQHHETSRKPENRGGGGSLFMRMMNRKKAKTNLTTPSLRSPEKAERLTIVSTPVTIDTDTGAEEVEVPLSYPCERVPSCADTTQTHEISDFSAQADEAKPVKRSSSARGSSQRALVLNAPMVPFQSTRSLRNFRRSGNESIGEAQPAQPCRGVLPPLLADDEESIAESSCSGITMDFTYGEEMKAPLQQPVGRLGEGVRETSVPASFVPPCYITTDDRDDMDEEDGFDYLDLPAIGKF